MLRKKLLYTFTETICDKVIFYFVTNKINDRMPTRIVGHTVDVYKKFRLTLRVCLCRKTLCNNVGPERM